MKKTVLLMGIVFLFMVGCAKNLASFDPSLPPELQSTLIIDSTVRITEFDGNKVKWGAGFFSYGFPWGKNTTIKIPSGNHTFTMEYKEEMPSGGNYTAKDISGQYNLEAGHTYKMNSQRLSGRVHIYLEEVSDNEL